MNMRSEVSSAQAESCFHPAGSLRAGRVPVNLYACILRPAPHVREASPGQATVTCVSVAMLLLVEYSLLHSEADAASGPAESTYELAHKHSVPYSTPASTYPRSAQRAVQTLGVLLEGRLRSGVVNARVAGSYAQATSVTQPSARGALLGIGDAVDVKVWLVLVRMVLVLVLVVLGAFESIGGTQP
jgi:hypothetical protein